MPKPRNRSRSHHESHGHAHIDARTPEYISWIGMIERCTNEKHKSFPSYGGRGILVCDRWLDSFRAFLADMGPRPPGTTLDRHPNNGGSYEPGNCRWATMKEQAANRRNTVRITANGETMTGIEWAARLGVNPNVIYLRMKAGWSPEKAVTTPWIERRMRRRIYFTKWGAQYARHARLRAAGLCQRCGRCPTYGKSRCSGCAALRRKDAQV